MNLHVGKVVVVGAGMTDHDAAAVAPGLQAEVLLLDRIAASSQGSTASSSRMHMGASNIYEIELPAQYIRTATYARPFSIELADRGWCNTPRVDEGLAKELNTWDGHLLYRPAADVLGLDCVPLGTANAS